MKDLKNAIVTLCFWAVNEERIVFLRFQLKVIIVTVVVDYEILRVIISNKMLCKTTNKQIHKKRKS